MSHDSNVREYIPWILPNDNLAASQNCMVSSLLYIHVCDYYIIVNINGELILMILTFSTKKKKIKFSNLMRRHRACQLIYKGKVQFYRQYYWVNLFPKVIPMIEQGPKNIIIAYWKCRRPCNLANHFLRFIWSFHSTKSHLK